MPTLFEGLRKHFDVPEHQVLRHVDREQLVAQAVGGWSECGNDQQRAGGEARLAPPGNWTPAPRQSPAAEPVREPPAGHREHRWERLAEVQ